MIVYADEPLGNEKRLKCWCSSSTERHAAPSFWSNVAAAAGSQTPVALAMGDLECAPERQRASTCAATPRPAARRRRQPCRSSVNQAASVKVALSDKVRSVTKTVGTVTVKVAKAGRVRVTRWIASFVAHTLAAGASSSSSRLSPKAGDVKSNAVTKTISVR